MRQVRCHGGCDREKATPCCPGVTFSAGKSAANKSKRNEFAGNDVDLDRFALVNTRLVQFTNHYILIAQLRQLSMHVGMQIARRLLVPCQPGIDKFLGLLSNPVGCHQDSGTESDHEQEVRRAFVG